MWGRKKKFPPDNVKKQVTYDNKNDPTIYI